MNKAKKESKTIPYSIRFDPEDLLILKKLAEIEEMPVSDFIRTCAINHAKNILAQKDLIEKLDPEKPKDLIDKLSEGNPKVAKETIFDAIKDVKDTFESTSKENYEYLKKELVFLKRRFERLAYSFHYHTRPVPKESSQEAAESAHERTNKLFSEITLDEEKAYES